MRILTLAFLSLLGLSACGGHDEAIVVVPQGATVICPDGTSATFRDGAYRC